MREGGGEGNGERGAATRVHNGLGSLTQEIDVGGRKKYRAASPSKYIHLGHVSYFLCICSTCRQMIKQKKKQIVCHRPEPTAYIYIYIYMGAFQCRGRATLHVRVVTVLPLHYLLFLLLLPLLVRPHGLTFTWWGCHGLCLT